MLKVLREIRDELKQTNSRVEALEHRQVQSEIRLATELVSVTKAVGEVRDLLRDRLDDRRRLDEHEQRIAALERRAG